MKPGKRIIELCERLVSPGHCPSKLSASEFHELADFIFELDNKNQWTRNLPTESGTVWWWNGDEDSCPIHIELGISIPSRQVFAQIDQYGWNRAQNVEEMGGWWMPLETPPQPLREQIRGVKG